MALTLVAALGVGLFSHLFAPVALQGHDAPVTYLIIREYVNELRAGWYPLVFHGPVGGGGVAFPLFYPPLAPLAGALLTILTGSLVMGVHLAYLASVVLSGWAMYALLRRTTSEFGLSIAGAVAYMALPYRITDVFMRSAFAESWSFVWIPLVALGAWRVFRDGRIPLYLPLAIAASILTHTITAPFTLLVAIAYGFAAAPGATLLRLGKVALAVVLGALLTAWHLFPQQFYLSSVWAGHPEQLWASAASVHEHRVGLRTLLTGEPLRRAMDLRLGWVQLGMVALSCGILMRGSLSGAQRWAAAAALTVWGLMVGFVMWPAPALTVLPSQIAYVQFPWRALAAAGFLGIALATAVFGTVRSTALRGAATAAIIVLAAGESLTVRLPPPIPEWTDAWLQMADDAESPGIGLTVRGEYIPRGVSPWAAAAAVRAAPRTTGDARVASWSRTREGLRLSVAAPGPATVTLPLLAYDLYAVRDGTGKPLEVFERGGLLAVVVEPGYTDLRVERRMPAAVWIGIGVSAAAAVLLIGLHAAGNGSLRRTAHASG